MPRVRVQVSNDEEYDECEELLENIQNGRTGNSGCGALILKVNEYLKKPTFDHDLSSILNKYLAILDSSNVYLDNGIISTNFAEAALLLQGAVTLHGKQVDLLWDFVIEYLNRNMSYEEKNEENKAVFEQLEERKTKYKRKRKVNGEVVEDGDSSSKGLVSFVVDKKSASVQGMHFDDFRAFVTIGEESKDDSTTYERNSFDNEYQDNWKEHWKNDRNPILEGKLRCGFTTPSSVAPEQSLLRHLDSNILYDKIIPLTYDLTEINMYGEREPMGDYGASSTFDRTNREFSALHSQVHSHDIPETQIEYEDVQDFILQQWLGEKKKTIENVYQRWDEFQADCKLYDDSMYKLKTKPCEEQPNRLVSYFEQPVNGPIASSEVATPLPAMSPIRESSAPEVMDISNIIDKRSDPTRKTMDSDMDSGVFDACSSMMDSTSHQETSIRALSVHSDGIFDMTLTPKQLSRPTTPSMKGMNETVVEEVVVKCLKRSRKKIPFDDFDIDDEGNLIELPVKKSRRIRERLRPTTTASLKAFNRFFCMNYLPENGEGALETIDEEDDEDNELGDLPEFTDEDFLNFAEPISTSTPHASQKPRVISTDMLLEDITDEPNVVNAMTAKSFADIMEQDAGTRLKHVLEWKKFITEKIGQQKKSDFDIHEEETKVIESIGDVGKTMPYKEMCESLPAAAVSRNFIAMLHLANTNNIEILNVQQGKLSNDSLCVKLLSTDRHHEQLNEYNAPSETTLKDKVHAVHAAMKRNHNGVSAHCSTAKKLKFH